MVKQEAEVLNTIDFDISRVEFSHYKDKYNFYCFVEKYKIADLAIHTLAVIPQTQNRTGN
jgi:hypothetical protein